MDKLIYVKGVGQKHDGFLCEGHFIRFNELRAVVCQDYPTFIFTSGESLTIRSYGLTAELPNIRRRLAAFQIMRPYLEWYSGDLDLDTFITPNTLIKFRDIKSFERRYDIIFVNGVEVDETDVDYDLIGAIQLASAMNTCIELGLNPYRNFN